MVKSFTICNFLTPVNYSLNIQTLNADYVGECKFVSNIHISLHMLLTLQYFICLWEKVWNLCSKIKGPKVNSYCTSQTHELSTCWEKNAVTHRFNFLRSCWNFLLSQPFFHPWTVSFNFSTFTLLVVCRLPFALLNQRGWRYPRT